MYEIWLTAICIITTARGMLLAWSWGYKEGKKVEIYFDTKTLDIVKAEIEK